MKRHKHKRKLNHVLILTSDAADANVRQFRVRAWIVEVVVLVLCVLIGGVIGWIWGDFTPLLATLIVCMTLDYISGVACAIVRKDVSSEVGFKGIVKKILILMLVGVAHVLDAYVLNSTPVLQSAVTMFFIANEGISLVENAAGLGIPIPKKMLEVLKQLKLKGDSTEKNESEEK